MLLLKYLMTKVGDSDKIHIEENRSSFAPKRPLSDAKKKEILEELIEIVRENKKLEEKANTFREVKDEYCFK